MDIDGQNYYLKPMNCPFHIMIYKSRMRSYRDLPLRWAELGTVYRYERSGVLHGLLRVRGFTQDDAHIFCTPEQIEDEILRALDFSLDPARSFGFSEFKIELSVRDPQITGKYAGSDAMWVEAEASLVKALTTRSLPYERMEGEAVFYGPKIDIKIKDALGRVWQCTTIQFDFNMSARFGMTYIGEDGKDHRPYMVHRALLGSLERFFGILIEHYDGNFPLWLAPVQVVLIPIADRQGRQGRDRYRPVPRKTGPRVQQPIITHCEFLKEDSTFSETRFLSCGRQGQAPPDERDDHGQGGPGHRRREESPRRPARPSRPSGLARDKGLDLVEIAASADPPVAKIMDYGKFLYEVHKKDHEAKKHQKQIQIKEIKFRPKISVHDYTFKMNHVKHFLEEGNKVKITVMLRGREKPKPELGLQILDRVLLDVKGWRPRTDRRGDRIGPCPPCWSPRNQEEKMPKLKTHKGSPKRGSRSRPRKSSCTPGE